MKLVGGESVLIGAILSNVTAKHFYNKAHVFFIKKTVKLNITRALVLHFDFFKSILGYLRFDMSFKIGVTAGLSKKFIFLSYLFFYGFRLVHCTRFYFTTMTLGCNKEMSNSYTSNRFRIFHIPQAYNHSY